jgi:subtilisin family serine protease
LVLATALMLAFSAAWNSPARADDDDYEANQVVVKLNPSANTTIDHINASYGTRTLEKLLGSTGVYLLQLPTGSDTEVVAQQMETDSRLLYAEPNFVAEAPEGDARHRARGKSSTKRSSAQYAHGALDLSCARNISQGQGTTVAILDTGAQLGHPALKANFEGVKRYDFVDDDTDPSDRKVGLDADGNGRKDELVGHGTHVAGIVDLVAPEAKIMPLRVLDSDGYGNAFVIAEAIYFAQRNGADVINLSLSTPSRSDLLQNAIKNVAENGTVVVAAAGNDNTAEPQYPAAGSGETAFVDGLLAVTSVDRYGKKSSFASYGSWVDVAAPGTDIRSAFPVSKYANWSGTSMAAPFITGQAALIHSVDGSLGPASIEKQIRDTARSLDTNNRTYAGMLGAGHANVGASLGQLRPDAGCGGAVVGSGGRDK